MHHAVDEDFEHVDAQRGVRLCRPRHRDWRRKGANSHRHDWYGRHGPSPGLGRGYYGCCGIHGALNRIFVETGQASKGDATVSMFS